MSRYIDADRLRKDILGLPNCYNGFSDTYDKALIIDRIDEQPTADVRENVRGKWIIKTDGFVIKRVWGVCSECGNILDFSGVNAGRGDANFCPNCGADMRGDQT